MTFLFRERRHTPPTSDSGIPQRSMGTYAGTMVTTDGANCHSATWGCLASISEAIQSLTLEEWRGTGDDRRCIAPPPMFYSPTPDHTWEDWIWEQVWALAGQGRCYAWISETDYRGNPQSLVPLDDSLVTWRYDRPRGRWITKVHGQGEVERWPLGPLWHCPLYTTPRNPQGMSPIAYHAESIGVGLAAQRFGSQFFGDGGHPTQILKTQRDIGETASQALKDKFMEVTSGNREPIVIPADTEIEKWQVAPDEAQFLETMRYSGEDVCRVFGVPPGKIGLAISGQNITYTNTAMANADWRSSGLSRYVNRLESHLSKLLPGGRNRTLRFNFRDFLRADLLQRAQAYKIYAEIGQLSGTPVMIPNEMRADEGFHPLPDGDTFDRIQQAAPPPTPNGSTTEENSE